MIGYQNPTGMGQEKREHVQTLLKTRYFDILAFAGSDLTKDQKYEELDVPGYTYERHDQELGRRGNGVWAAIKIEQGQTVSALTFDKQDWCAKGWVWRHGPVYGLVYVMYLLPVHRSDKPRDSFSADFQRQLEEEAKRIGAHFILIMGDLNGPWINWQPKGPILYASAKMERKPEKKRHDELLKAFGEEQGYQQIISKFITTERRYKKSLDAMLLKTFGDVNIEIEDLLEAPKLTPGEDAHHYSHAFRLKIEVPRK